MQSVYLLNKRIKKNKMKIKIKEGGEEKLFTQAKKKKNHSEVTAVKGPAVKITTAIGQFSPFSIPSLHLLSSHTHKSRPKPTPAAATEKQRCALLSLLIDTKASFDHR